MDTAVVDAPVPVTHEGPYVGLRPFEAHERDLFFGRERDAQFLVDKVLSARITVLYAQSGVGKSSLLHTLTIPELEREHCFVVYVNTWPAGDLLGAARAALVSAARDVHVADPDAGAPSLRELVGLLAAARNRSIVLVFDQFEEVLAAPGGPPPSLRRELAEVVRGGVDARVLVSMREEFLAALEPFRSEIVTLLQSTYRLDRLDAAGVAKAIVEPVRLFGGTCDPGLVKRLVTDLSSSASRLQDVSSAQGVELPLLQLVCKELWEEATKRGTSTLDVDLYEKMGGAAQVINTYVHRKMPHRWSDKKVAARLLKFLAPPSGMKISYSVADLSAHTRLPARRIRDILEKLCRSQIMRSRRVLEDERFELQHDAFIRILVPWRDQVLVRATQYRLAVAAAALIAAVLVAPAAFRRGMEAYEYHTTVRLKLPDLEAQCLTDPRAAATILEQITGHLLLRSSRPTRLEDLRNVLVSHERCLPAGYGVTKAGPAFVEQLPPEWRVRLRYSSSRRLDELYFEATWHGVAQRLTAELGVPVPNRIATFRDPTMPARFVELIFPGGDPLRLDDVPIQEDRVFFSEAAQSAAAREFLARFKSEWEPLPDIGFAGPWRVVPRWGTPILTATRETALDGSGYLALRLATELQSRPELLVTPAAVDILLNRVREGFPATVAEAEAVRGALLRSDLVELLKLDMPLRHPPMILDALAGHPASESPAKAARAVVQDLGAPSVRLPYSAGQPRAERPAAPPPVTDDLKPYRDAEKWLPELAAPIRVYLGKELESHWSTRDALHPEIVEALEELRDEQWRRFGVLMPGVRFRRSLDRPEMPEWSFQIETLNREGGNPDDGPVRVDLASASQRLIAELRSRVEKYRVYWVSAEDVNLLRASMPPALAAWLGQRYSTTDIKTLIRAVISPQADAPVKPMGTAAAISGSHSARHTRWLLQSMVFWAAVDPVSDVGRMADRLRMTQAALQNRSAQSPGAEPSGDVRLGVDALLAQRDAEAAAWFGRAVQAGRDQAIRDFLASYPKRVAGVLHTDILAGCTDPTQPRLDRPMLIDLRDMMATRPDRSLKLCLYAAYGETRRAAKATLAGDLLAGKGPQNWPPREAAWFSEQVVRAYDPLRDPPELLRHATRLLKDAATRLEYAESVKLVTNVAEICNSSGARNWCFDLLDELARARPEGDIPIEVAWQLSWRQRASDLRRALDLAEMVARTAAERGLQAASPARHYDFALFSRANALKGLFEISGDASTQESEKLLRGLLTSAAVSQAAHQQLIELLLADGRYDEAERLLNSAQEQWSNDATFFMQRFWVDLLQGRTEAAAMTAQRAEKATGASVEGLFVAALGQVLTRSGQWEYAARKLIGSQHQYVDYIAMLLYATQPESQRQEARELLDQRWGEIDPRSWDRRLRGGDESAWRETLIGYYLGKVGRDAFLGVLEDDAAFAGSAFAQLPIPRKGLLCEAYFYDALLAKAGGQVPQMRERLERAMRTGMRFYFEHKMAKFLLAGNSG